MNFMKNTKLKGKTMQIKLLLLSIFTLIVLTACSGDKPKESLTEGGMKCGPGKCGASMMDGSAVLVKKKMNILNQLREDDTRRQCVLDATTTKILYDCVRVEKTGRLSTKCSSDNTKNTQTMKCEVGKCGSGMEKNIPKQENVEMKCAPGKCGANM